MPCRSDYLEPNERETESRLVASLLVRTNARLGLVTPAWIRGAANDMYGNIQRVDDLTERLCTLCGSLTKEQANLVIYDGRNADARKLADWWDRHQKADKAREAKEKADALTAEVRRKALLKLSPKERKALGLKD